MDGDAEYTGIPSSHPEIRLPGIICGVRPALTGPALLDTPFNAA
jgi:hypothetical protein